MLLDQVVALLGYINEVACHILFTNNDDLYSPLVLQFRFTLLCHAACEAPLVLPLGGYTYGEKCMFLVNDWHAGLVSAYAFLNELISYIY